jgi:hypothetical protein
MKSHITERFAEHYRLPTIAIVTLQVFFARRIFLNTEETWQNVIKQHKAKSRVPVHIWLHAPIDPGFFPSSSAQLLPNAPGMSSMSSSLVGNLPKVCWRICARSPISCKPYWPIWVLSRVGLSPSRDFVMVVKASSLKSALRFMTGTGSASNTN